MAIGQANVPIGRRTLAPVNARRKPWRSQLRVLAGLLCLTAAVAGISKLHVSPSPHPQRHSSTVVPSALVPQLSASIGASQRSFWPVRDGGSLHGSRRRHPEQLQRVRCRAGSRPRNGRALPGGPRPGSAHLSRSPPSAPVSSRNEVLYRHGSLTEFYRNGPYGLEQGFTLKQRPQAGTGPLVLSLSLDGSLTPKQVGSQILFRNRAGADGAPLWAAERG